ncbi:TlpA family protein disulfide reductase [Mycolicibacterium parafortuitum]|uniref:Thioredoxin [Mycobacterium leprae TN] n=1 Tax=Mycolicibacterium parafortuitum TaxID=39692 RepID=A0A375YB24_MYCPF|nr:thioredoxin family protein [Mycolicibacterium parafortuitum]ORB31727.1 thiol reductase thioredoxin [Mycolicibacterium parafortuitum]SRX78288.1 thioredoxin [Mycobacterium leprae TN] [Mycolicibacterium parafortuitum]
MSSSWIAVIAVLIGVFGVAFVIGRLMTLRSGLLKGAAEWPALDDGDVEDLGLSRTGPTVLHFSATWCGPCVGLRRIVDQVCAELPGVAHVEIDMDANPEAARKLSVLSLPTTFIFDTEGRQRYRASGVPTAADLRAAVEPLLA